MPLMPPRFIVSTAEDGTITRAPFSFNPSNSMFIARRCRAVGLSAYARDASANDHLRWTIRSIAGTAFDHLLGFQAKSIRQTLTGRPTPENVFVVDRHWSDRPVDLVVGDLAFLPAGSRSEGSAVEIVDQSAERVTIRAVRRGLARAEDARAEWSSFIRVMPKCYDGAAVHRHLEDPDES